MKRILTIAGLLFGWLLALPALAQTVTLNFDDGTAGSLVGGHYSGQGITFQDASWRARGAYFRACPERWASTTRPAATSGGHPHR